MGDFTDHQIKRSIQIQQGVSQVVISVIYLIILIVIAVRFYKMLQNKMANNWMFIFKNYVIIMLSCICSLLYIAFKNLYSLKTVFGDLDDNQFQSFVQILCQFLMLMQIVFFFIIISICSFEQLIIYLKYKYYDNFKQTSKAQKTRYLRSKRAFKTILTIFNAIFFIGDFIEIMIIRDVQFFQFMISVQCVILGMILCCVFMILASSNFQFNCKLKFFQIAIVFSLVGRGVYTPLFYSLNKNNNLYIYFITYFSYPVLLLVIMNVLLIFFFEIFPMIIILNTIQPKFALKVRRNKNSTQDEDYNDLRQSIISEDINDFKESIKAMQNSSSYSSIQNSKTLNYKL